MIKKQRVPNYSLFTLSYYTYLSLVYTVLCVYYYKLLYIHKLFVYLSNVSM